MNSALTVTPIGTSPAWYNAGAPCSGTLVDVDGYRMLVDCGSGVMTRYLALDGGSPPAIDAIVITHVHPDHVFDLVPLKYGLLYGPIAWDAPQLWLPPGGHGRLQRLAAAFDGGEDFFTETFDVRSYSAGARVSVGPFEMRSAAVPHFIESFALRFDHAHGSVVFSSDLGPTDVLDGLARNADMLLCEACVAAGVDLPEGAGHLTPDLAGSIARRAGVGSLLLNHMPIELDPEQQRRAAAREFDGPVGIAEPLATYDVARGVERVA